MPNPNPGEHPHPCVVDGCSTTVPYDDEPWCFEHSPNSGSAVPGYSWAREHGLEPPPIPWLRKVDGTDPPRWFDQRP